MGNLEGLGMFQFIRRPDELGLRFAGFWRRKPRPGGRSSAAGHIPSRSSLDAPPSREDRCRVRPASSNPPFPRVSRTSLTRRRAAGRRPGRSQAFRRRLQCPRRSNRRL